MSEDTPITHLTALAEHYREQVVRCEADITSRASTIADLQEQKAGWQAKLEEVHRAIDKLQEDGFR